MAGNRKVPLFEQIDELQSEWDRRCRAYPLMEAKGLIRHHVVQMKQGRLSAAISTLLWLDEHRDLLMAFAEYHGKYMKVEREIAAALEADPAEAEMPEAAE